MIDSYRIVFPRGDRKKLTVAWVLSYEEDEYCFASRECFSDEDEAEKRMIELAEHHGLEHDGSKDPYRFCLD